MHTELQSVIDRIGTVFWRERQGLSWQSSAYWRNGGIRGPQEKTQVRIQMVLQTRSPGDPGSFMMSPGCIRPRPIIPSQY